MSHRPSQSKKLRRLRKALRQTPPRYINLIEWLCDRGYAQTAGQARELIIAGRVKADSHPIGIAHYTTMDGREHAYAEPFVRASLKDGLHVD